MGTYAKYIGPGPEAGYLEKIPARDLTADELGDLDAEQRHDVFASGLYERVTEAAPVMPEVIETAPVELATEPRHKKGHD